LLIGNNFCLFVEKRWRWSSVGRLGKNQFGSNLHFAIVGLEIRQERLKL
jgi:hypothetical protein